jgi:hypothetical protein
VEQHSTEAPCLSVTWRLALDPVHHLAVSPGVARPAVGPAGVQDPLSHGFRTSLPARLEGSWGAVPNVAWDQPRW